MVSTELGALQNWASALAAWRTPGARRTHMQLDLSRAVARRRRQLLEVSIADEFDAR